MKKYFVWMALLLGTALCARASVVTETVTYKDHEGTVCEGVWAYDDAADGPLPCVIIFHQWGGAGPYETARAKMLAEQGYVAFVADIYSKGIRPATFDQRRVLSTQYKEDRPMTRARAQAALDTVLASPRVQADHIASIGYCFGGFVSLELARSGAPIQAAVSIHGLLNTPTPEDAKNIKGKVLAQHGAIDPYVPAEELAAFKTEMDNAGVDYRVIEYPNAVHAFTDWNAGNDPSTGAAYDEAADKASWKDLLDFLAGVLKPATSAAP